jgi:dTDP-4-amino-4,6-dideoxygalactose transaminase
MNIPLVDLRAGYFPLKEEILAGMAEALDGMQLFLGKNVQQFEKDFAQFCGVNYAIGVSSGTDAIELILRAAGIGPGDEVITVSHTFIATIEAILLCGARPVFVDITPDTCLMDVEQIESKINPRTKAILPVHLYGQTAEMLSIRTIAKRHRLWVFEDACQAHGALYQGRAAGGLGDAGAFSFYFTKNLGAYGEGGMITTDNEEIARKARMLRDHGSSKKYIHELLGKNARLDELQAVVLRARLPHLNEWNNLRREHATVYNYLLKESVVRLPKESNGNKHVYHLYVIQTTDRDALQAFLKDQGVGTGIHYPVPAHLQPALADLGYKPGDLPVTERVTTEILSLPMYPELSNEQLVYIADKIIAFEGYKEPAIVR